jgi:hypothetical protein
MDVQLILHFHYPPTLTGWDAEFVLLESGTPYVSVLFSMDGRGNWMGLTVQRRDHPLRRRYLIRCFRPTWMENLSYTVSRGS